VGTSGSGKTTFARRLSKELGLPFLESDAIYHQPNWEPLDTDDFRRIVKEFTAQVGWIVDGNYSIARDITWGRADTVIFLDLPRWAVMAQIIPRTLRRAARKEELWNGNRETFKYLLTRTDENVLWWAWKTHAKNRERYEAASSNPKWSHIEFIHLKTRAEIASFQT
jgi:adenylate kinase family enzyme